MLDEDRLEDLVALCLERAATDGTDAVDDVCTSHPEYAAEIRRRFAVAVDLGLVVGPADRSHAGPPERLGEFRIMDKIGEGGMGVVFRAEQEGLDRSVALKIIRPELVLFEGSRRRFRREANAVAKLAHPGIVPVHAVGEDDGLPWFVMDLIEGVSLERLIDALRKPNARSDGRDNEHDAEAIVPTDVRRLPHLFETLAGVPLDEDGKASVTGSWETVVARWVRQVADALAHAHGRGVLHRDVKPSNLILKPSGQVVLVDFGLAREDEASSLTKSGHQPGSLPYMAPEQVRGATDAIDVRTDIYGLGITGYELLTLTKPYAATTQEELRTAILDGRPRPVRSRAPATSWEAETVCLTAMNADPARRYATAVDFARDLGHVLDREPIEARRAGVIRRLKRSIERAPARAAAIVLGVIAFVGTPLAVAWKESDARHRVERQKLATEDQRDEARTARDQERDARRHAEASLGLLREILSSSTDWTWLANDADPGRLDARIERLIEELADLPEARIALMEDVARHFGKLGLHSRAAAMWHRVESEYRTRGERLSAARAVAARARIVIPRRLESPAAVMGELDDAIELLDQSGSSHEALRARLSKAEAARFARQEDVACDIVADLARRIETARQGSTENANQDGDTIESRRDFPSDVAHLAFNLKQDKIAARLFESLILEHEGDDRNAMFVASWRTDLGQILSRRGELKRAATLYDKVLATLDRNLTTRSPRVGVVNLRLGLTLAGAGRKRDAERMIRKGLDLTDGNETWRSLRGNGACRLARLLRDRKQWKECIHWSKIAVDLRTDADGFPTRPALHCLRVLGQVYRRIGRLDDAVATARRGLEVAEHYDPDAVADVALFNIDIGIVRVGQKRWADALEVFDAAMSYFHPKAAAPNKSDNTVRHFRSLASYRGACLKRLERFAEAAEVYDEQIELVEAENETRFLLQALDQASFAWGGAEEHRNATERMTRATDVSATVFGKDSMEQAQRLRWWGDSLLRQATKAGRLEAATVFERSRAIRYAKDAADTVDTAYVEMMLGSCLIDAGRFDDAETHLRHAAAIYRKAEGENGANFGQVKSELRRSAAARANSTP